MSPLKEPVDQQGKEAASHFTAEDVGEVETAQVRPHLVMLIWYRSASLLRVWGKCTVTGKTSFDECSFHTGQLHC